MSSVLLYFAVVMLLLIRPHVEVTPSAEDGNGATADDGFDTSQPESSALLGVDNTLAPGSPVVDGKSPVGRRTHPNSPFTARNASLSPYRDRSSRLHSPSVVVDDLSDVDAESPISPVSRTESGAGGENGMRRQRSRGGRGRRSRRESENASEALSLFGREGEDAQTVADRRRSSMIRLSMSEEMQAGV